MHITEFITKMPKVEIHVHLEGSIRPETLIALAKRNRIALPAGTPAELEQWYTFTDFSHFIDIYRYFARCLRTADDIELITRQFLLGQSQQNIRYSEVTYTPYSQYRENGIPFQQQLEAIQRAGTWASKDLGVEMGLVVDISRDVTPQEGMRSAQWAVDGMNFGVCALGLGGDERGNPPEKFRTAFEYAYQAGLPAVPHAGETGDAKSIWGALEALHAVRIGHGIRCLEDPNLVRHLREQQIPLEICPSSNLCLNLVPSLPQHPLPHLIQEGLLVSINSDDPPMFNTTLTREYQLIAETFNLDQAKIEALVLNSVRASLLPPEKKTKMLTQFREEFRRIS